MFNDLPPIEELYNNRLHDEIKFKAPKFCKNCNHLDAGEGFNTQLNKETIIPVCEKFPDGVPKKFSECLEMDRICVECPDNINCHIIDGEPEFSPETTEDCARYQHEKENRKMSALIFNKFFCGRE